MTFRELAEDNRRCKREVASATFREGRALLEGDRLRAEVADLHAIGARQDRWVHEMGLERIALQAEVENLNARIARLVDDANRQTHRLVWALNEVADLRAEVGAADPGESARAALRSGPFARFVR